MVERRASCPCGELSAVCTGEPVRIAVCHCLACKRHSGSAFSFNAWFRESDVRLHGRASEYTRVGDEGSRITSSFCPNCGGAVYYRNNNIPDFIGVRAGTFAALDFPPPTVSVYHESRRFPWIEIRTEPLAKRG